MDKELKLLLDRAEDAVRLCNMRDVPKFVGFLSTSEAAEINRAVKSPNVVFFGGSDGCERTVFGVLPDYISDKQSVFPIDIVAFCYPKGYKLSHRDVLGSLMSKGITRQSVGDIIFSEGIAYAFVLQDVSRFVIEQTDKIGNVGVTARLAEKEEILSLDHQSKKLPINFTVPSMRLDAVICGLIGTSRTKCEELIENGFVSVNSFEAQKAVKKVVPGDIITVRGKGKFKIVSTGPITRKGRETVSAEKFV